MGTGAEAKTGLKRDQHFSRFGDASSCRRSPVYRRLGRLGYEYDGCGWAWSNQGT